MTGIYELTLRAPDGRERRTLAWFPTDEVRQDFYKKARKRGLEIIESESEKFATALAGDSKIIHTFAAATTDN